MWLCDIYINQYQTSREDDRFGVVDTVLAYGTEGTQIESSFLQSVMYREEIFVPFVHLFKNAFRPNIIFMNNNSVHVGLIDETHQLDFSARSPDVNPVYHT
ncbi:hypothetical protein TNCV_1240981 [Trichonephila clavipes]|uniref:Uncharacterized protein n=1 Tax=Trichonephila clavipes TaxID=2585209 RepID=A0A8X6WDW9_TRICX|nr:hypothetical protein TNCV_1240981 [Trichonephila clavipes]